MLPAHDSGLNLFWDASEHIPSRPQHFAAFKKDDFVLMECRVVRRQIHERLRVTEFRLGALTRI